MTTKAENLVRNAMAWTRALAALIHDGKDKDTLKAAARSAEQAAAAALKELDG